MMVSTLGSPNVPELTLFNTLVPSTHPENSQRFRVPQRYHRWWTSVFVESDKCFGTLDRDRLFVTDPTHAILVVQQVSNHGERVLIIVRIQTFIEHLCSVNTDACTSWDEWKGGVVIMKVTRPGGSDRVPHPLVQGARVILVKRRAGPGNNNNFYLCTFDFSRRGCSILPLLDEVDGTERRALFEDGRDFSLQENERMSEWGFNSLGNGNSCIW